MTNSEIEELNKETERLLAEMRESIAGTWYNRDKWEPLARPGWFKCRMCGTIDTFEKVPNKPCSICELPLLMYEYGIGKRKPRGFHLSDADRMMLLDKYDELMEWSDLNRHPWPEEK
jgi:hypothetical protein